MGEWWSYGEIYNFDNILLLRLETVHADNFVTFNCDERTAGVVLAARKQLDLVIQSKLSDPRQVYPGT